MLIFFSDIYKLPRAGGPESSGIPRIAAALPEFPRGIQDEDKSGKRNGKVERCFCPWPGWLECPCLPVSSLESRSADRGEDL